CASQNDLASHTDGRIFLESDRRLLLIAIVEDYGDAGLRHTGLSTLVDEVLRARVSAKSALRCPSREALRLTCRFCARTVDMLVMPRTKQMASRMLDFPLPFRPVIELKLSSLSPWLATSCQFACNM